ncbi:stearoyl-coa desaturase [Danaus plexippus plexippus]|uniref:Stearoyl-coa desaturase n=2 Tax=Danaus plexippus TaxID=13037 RepID=A0A212EQ51_DANPL|nr:stearoyl-coa desaturase [Danaus plexippus plexippus]
MTILFLVFLVSVGLLGMTTGAHRLWAHRTYEANSALRIALMLFQTLAGIGPIYDWVQYHRLHHAYFKTESDPYNPKNGFLHAHFFTRLQKLSPKMTALKDAIDMSDLQNDGIVMFQQRFYWVLYGIIFLLLPLNAPMEYWDESILSTFFIIGILRYAFILHGSWLIESGVCVWGLQEGEKYPPDSNTVFILNRTFWPEYHYIYPQDYKSGEYGTYGSGCSTAFIRMFAVMGLAKDLRTLESATLQKALAEYARTKQPLDVCFKNALNNQVLPEEHYLKRD